MLVRQWYKHVTFFYLVEHNIFRMEARNINYELAWSHVSVNQAVCCIMFIPAWSFNWSNLAHGNSFICFSFFPLLFFFLFGWEVSHQHLGLSVDCGGRFRFVAVVLVLHYFYGATRLILGDFLFFFFFHFIVGFNWLKSLAVSYCLLMLELCQNTKVLLENHIHFKLQSHGHSVMIRNSNNKDKAIVRRSHQASFKLRQN